MRRLQLACLFACGCFYSPTGTPVAGTTTAGTTDVAPSTADLESTSPTTGTAATEVDPSTTTTPTTTDTDTGTTTGDAAPAVPVLTLMTSAIKQFEFSWPPAAGAEVYTLSERRPGAAEFEPIAEDLVATAYTRTVPLHLLPGASYGLRACNAAGCAEAEPVVPDEMVGAIGYFKASNTDEGDNFGRDVALSADGTTLVVGADHEDGISTGIDGPQGDGVVDSGAVYVFTRDGDGGTQQAYIKPTVTAAELEFGASVAVSADGDTLVVGAPGESSGVDGQPLDISAPESGSVYVFTRVAGVWSQQAYLKAVNIGAEDRFGVDVAVSADGDTLVVGASEEDSSSTGIDSVVNDNGDNNGAVYVFTRTGSDWAQSAYIKASNTGDNDLFGARVALSADGATLAVGAFNEDSDATGVGGDAFNDLATGAGAVYVFTYANNAWAQQAYIKASNTGASDWFGATVALAGDGDTLVVGAPLEDSASDDEADDSADGAGAVYVFTRAGTAWSQQAYLKPASAHAMQNFATALALASDGDILAVGAAGDNAGSDGVVAMPGPGVTAESGAVHVFVRQDGAWSRRSHVKASRIGAQDNFGNAVALSGDGETLAVGALAEDSAAISIGGDPNNEGAVNAGAVYLY